MTWEIIWKTGILFLDQILTWNWTRSFWSSSRCYWFSVTTKKMQTSTNHTLFFVLIMMICCALTPTHCSVWHPRATAQSSNFYNSPGAANWLRKKRWGTRTCKSSMSSVQKIERTHDCCCISSNMQVKISANPSVQQKGRYVQWIQ